MQIRPARPDEAEVLAGIAVRAKAHWGYPAAFIARFARSLGLTPEVVTANDVWVAERASVVVGFYSLLHRGELTVLDDLWLEPEEIGRGLGRWLFEHARDRAAAAGAEVLEWEAEPYAVGFYERMGGHRVRMADSSLGRKLPVMQLALGAVRTGKPAAGPPAL
ncbi:GNAT family N-acetyltransferase [Pseudonocardia bannensis]|uniref:GNAT family N-acetyltransferase n=1 Tax=Pseudonocardia bannensis TaxID=630973 RepID=A0A848DHF5_9PSEU|nr:GNAT family N-acetyltransferase [Pseudonocardia bannensis]NMH91934.1 GNAT family N-acetyltransferase [Pseudonocardia bannensis]